MKEKITFIFIPVLLFSLGSMIVYSAFNWLVFKKLNLFASQELVRVAVPIVLALAVCWLLIEPRMKFLYLSSPGNSWRKLYDMLGFILILFELLVIHFSAPVIVILLVFLSGTIIWFVMILIPEVNKISLKQHIESGKF
jgi:hypothetical protein